MYIVILHCIINDESEKAKNIVCIDVTVGLNAGNL